MEKAGKKYISPEELREFGYLQEVNRQFFHPLGMALALLSQEEASMRTRVRDFMQSIPDGPDEIDIGMALLAEFGVKPGVRIIGVYDDRDDPEGIIFGDGPDPEKVERVAQQFLDRSGPRSAKLGYIIQPYEVPDNAGS